MAYITRLTKTSMLDALNQDYIRTVKVKRVKVIFKHAEKWIQEIYVVLWLPIFLIKSYVRRTFIIGGLGTEFVTSIVNRDYTMIMAITIFLAVLMVRQLSLQILHIN